MTLLTLLADDRAPALVALCVVVIRVLYAIVSRVVAPYPRARAAVEAVAALGPDLLRAIQQARSAVTGRPVAPLDLRHPEHDPAALLAERDALRARVAELAAAAAEHRAPRPTDVP